MIPALAANGNQPAAPVVEAGKVMDVLNADQDVKPPLPAPLPHVDMIILDADDEIARGVRPGRKLPLRAPEEEAMVLAFVDLTLDDEIARGVRPGRKLPLRAPAEEAMVLAFVDLTFDDDPKKEDFVDPS